MKFTRERFSVNAIVAYEPGLVRVRLGQNGESPDPETALREHRRSLILTPQQLIEDWAPQQIAELTADHWQAVLGLQPEVILLGTGKRLTFPPMAILSPCHQAGIGIEVMDTSAACRTFNILASEGRNVVAALMMIE